VVVLLSFSFVVLLFLLSCCLVVVLLSSSYCCCLCDVCYQNRIKQEVQDKLADEYNKIGDAEGLSSPSISYSSSSLSSSSSSSFSSSASSSSSLLASCEGSPRPKRKIGSSPDGSEHHQGKKFHPGKEASSEKGPPLGQKGKGDVPHVNDEKTQLLRENITHLTTENRRQADFIVKQQDMLFDAQKFAQQQFSIVADLGFVILCFCCLFSIKFC